MKKFIVIFYIVTALTGLISSPALSLEGDVEIIDTPTAESVGFGSYDLSFRLYDRGSIMARLLYGIIMKDLTLGLSFDAENVVGAGEVKAHRPYLYIKLPLYTGGYKWPAVSVGFDEQGLGRYDDTDKIYQFNPMGFFMVMTKTGMGPGLNMGAGINADYSITKTDDTGLKGFVNASYTLGPEFMMLAEVRDIYSWSSYVNAGARYMLTPELHFEFSALNIGGIGKVERIISVNYSGRF
ncbi:MAG: hypothetical protein PF545_06835 [Elusimicrobia bacterium]|jgi:hypothetical protein|nr:hypothetical protein [Elusimicrobiota bacterium]